MSNNPIIAALKEALEVERNDEMTAYELCTGPVGYRNGHEAATARLMSVIEKAVEMAEYYGGDQNKKIGDKRLWEILTYDDCGKKAREFLTNVSEFVADATTLADASGEITKPGHYTLDAESFNKIIDDLDKEPSEQVKKAREKFLQLKKEAPDENK